MSDITTNIPEYLQRIENMRNNIIAMQPSMHSLGYDPEQGQEKLKILSEIDTWLRTFLPDERKQALDELAAQAQELNMGY